MTFIFIERIFGLCAVLLVALCAIGGGVYLGRLNGDPYAGAVLPGIVLGVVGLFAILKKK